MKKYILIILFVLFPCVTLADTVFKAEDERKVIDSTTWKFICNYGEIVMYYNNDNYSIIRTNDSSDVITNLSFESIEQGKCPHLFKMSNNKYYVYDSEFEEMMKDAGQGYMLSDPSVNLSAVPEQPVLKKCRSLLGNPKCSGKNVGDECEGKNATPAYYLSIAFKLIRWAAIIIIIVMSILEFTGATASGDEDQLQKVIKRTGIRLGLCVLIFLLPMLIDYLLSLLDQSSVSDCINLSMK